MLQNGKNGGDKTRYLIVLWDISDRSSKVLFSQYLAFWELQTSPFFSTKSLPLASVILIYFYYKNGRTVAASRKKSEALRRLTKANQRCSKTVIFTAPWSHFVDLAVNAKFLPVFWRGEECNLFWLKSEDLNAQKFCENTRTERSIIWKSFAPLAFRRKKNPQPPLPEFSWFSNTV